MARDDRFHVTLYDDIWTASIEELHQRFAEPCRGEPTLDRYRGKHELDCVGGGFERCMLCGLPSDPAGYRQAVGYMFDLPGPRCDECGFNVWVCSTLFEWGRAMRAIHDGDLRGAKKWLEDANLNARSI